MGIKALRVNEIETARWGSRGIMSKPSPVKRFRHYIEHSNWDDDLLKYEKWIDLSCIGGIAVSVVFFLPVALAVLRGW